jgi:hypothetical protein
MAEINEGSNKVKSTDDKDNRRKVHLVVAGASEFGQYACARVLHRAYAHVTKVTLIVARKDEHLFQTRRPAAAEWSHFSSLKECLEKLKSEGRPIDYVFDDHIQYLAAELLKEVGDYDRIGYVATRGEEHLPYTTILSTCCDRVLVEKPLSKCAEDVHPNGLFKKLEKRIKQRWHPGKEVEIDEIITTCEHFTFRKSFSDAKKELVNFVKNHWNHGKLKYEFRFLEPTKADDLVKRLHAMQDGSILDVGVTHGLGPLSFILRKKFEGNKIDLHQSITWNQVLVKQAREEATQNAPLTVPVLAETAAYLKGTCKVDNDHEIELEIKSGKGGGSFDRYFKFVCPHCKNGDDECFIGVSLGVAGYTICTWKKENNKVKPADGLPDIVIKDGGWDSDKRGSTQPVAENAQAAMLEAFIQGIDDRFIPLEHACQIVRLGMEAQAIAFCQERTPYTLDQKFDGWPEDCQNNHKDNQPVHVHLKDVWNKAHETALDRLKIAIGVKNKKVKNKKLSKEKCFRVVTIFGPEGLGNTDISEKLHEELNRELKRDNKDEDIVHLIKVPRDIEWCRGRGSSAFGVERVMRDLGEALGIAIDVRKDTASDLCARIHECKEILKRKPCILIINGIDRLDTEAYAQLIGVLNQLPPTIRIIMVTNKGEQTCGWVIRSEELIGEKELLKTIKDIPDRHGVELRNYLGGVVSKGTLEDEEKKKDFSYKISQFADDNLTLYRQLCSYFRFIVFPNVTEIKIKLLKEELKSVLDRELTALSLPRTITPYPEAMLDRISSLCIGSIQSAENLRLLRAMAEVPDRIPKEFLDSLQPGLSEQMEIKGKIIPLNSVIEHTPEWNDETFDDEISSPKSLKTKDIDEGSDRNTFALFPRVRMSVCNHDEIKIQQVCADVDRRRTSLNVPFDPGKPGRFYINLSLELLFNLETPYGFGRLNLENGSLFGKRCQELSVALERGHIGRPDSRLHKFLTTLLKQKTNLGLENRAYMIALEAWMHLRSVKDPKDIIPLMEQIAEAYDIALSFVPFNEAFNDPYYRNPFKKDDEEKKEGVEEKKPDIALMRYLVSASMELEGTWYWLYDVEAPTPPHYSEQLNKKVKEAEKSIKDYVEKNPNLSTRNELGTREMERLAVLMRELSLLDAYKEEKENILDIDNLFNAEITLLKGAYKLLVASFKKSSNDASGTEPEKGICIRLGVNQSVLALLYYHRYLRAIKLEGDDAKKKKALASAAKALASAAKALKDLQKIYKDHKFKFDMCPFSLLALARLRNKGANVKYLEPGKTPKQLIKEARNIFCLTGRDYFSGLAEEMEKEFTEEKETNQKGG